jgi:hypothetical protein
MALDFSGIENVEFYSGHYLEAVLEGDLQSTYRRWVEQEEEGEGRAPHKRLAGLAEKWFAMQAQADGERDPAERWRVARDFHVHFLEALGYPYERSTEPLETGEAIPTLLSLRRDGNPFLWVVDAPPPESGDDDPLTALPLEEQYPTEDGESVVPQATWRELLDGPVFRQDHAPRWVLFLSGREALLVERHKWAQGRYLRFDLGDLMGRRQTSALRAVAGLLHRDVLAPDTGLCLHDTLEENSHKHAFAVSDDLKHGVRRAVELLANEAVYYRREIQRRGVFNEDELAEGLTQDSLTWMYRLLFLLYVEARGGELGVVPMGSDTYRAGYSLEGLRDLELVPLTTDQALNGYYLHESLQRLFTIVNQGFPNLDGTDQLVLDGETVSYRTMQLDALRSPLFDDDRLVVLKGVRFRNFVLQEILQLMSLSAQKKGKKRGRISYAQLGINQLGAVYEGLLSYTGFFATEDLFEVAAEKDCSQLSGKPASEREALKTYFVPASRIGDYKEGEIVRDEEGKKVVHPKGDYIFRLAGRNREKSASYYTPEVLTQCLVKYALKELLWDEGDEGAKPTRKRSADEILSLTICEPAMGSSAFLIEAVDQLADAYLETRQEEVRASGGETIPPENYQREKRRVKARLATNNCYGVDLNPTAVELAKVSLWLATLHEDGKCPWFGLRLATGNSLVGARREVFRTADVTRKGTKADPNWLGLVPEPVPLHHGEEAPLPASVDWANWTTPRRPKGTIYHFLLPAAGMVPFDKDNVIKQLAPESVKRIKEWRKEFCRPFNKTDAERLEQISDAVDRLFAQVVCERVLATQETSDRIPVWGEFPSVQQANLLVRDQEEVAASLEDGSSAYRRLKLAMDAWCALWFWPIEEVGLLPDRSTWLAQMELILKGEVTLQAVYEQGNLFAELGPVSHGELRTSQSKRGEIAPSHDGSAERLKRLQALSDAFRERRADYFDECGLADIDAALEGDATLLAAQAIADRLRFHHWSLRFAEVFVRSGGFDLSIGNPPWIKWEWEEAGVLSDFEPTLAIRKLSAGAVAKGRSAGLIDSRAMDAYMTEFENSQGFQSYVGVAGNFPLLRGVVANLYKCFVTRAWDLGSTSGVVAFVHPDGLFDDPKAGKVREALYPRLATRFHFINELRLFPEVHHLKKYSVNCYRASGSDNVRAVSVADLFHPATIDPSFTHDGRGAVPGMKTATGEWDVSPHRSRLVEIGEDTLALFASLFDAPGTPSLQARLPVVHSLETLSVLRKFSSQPQYLGDQSEHWLGTQLFNETGAQQDGTIVKQQATPSQTGELIIQGAHFFLGTPFYKTPNEGCSHQQDYTAIDLSSVRSDYLPTTNYVRACEPQVYASRMQAWRGRPVVDSARVGCRGMVTPTGERTLVACLLPPGAAHIHGCFSLAMEDRAAALVAGSFQSIVFDFFVKTTGKSNFQADVANLLPFIEDELFSDLIISRALLLNCVTEHYSDLWNQLWAGVARHGRPTKDLPRLRDWRSSPAEWTWGSPARSDMERRQILVETDVLVAMALRLALEELFTIYRVQFPILQEYERERLYDQHGRIIPTSKTASGNPAVSLVELAATLKQQAGFDLHAECHPDGLNTQELRKQKIRLGKKESDVLGVSERCTMADLLSETEVRWSDEDHPEGRLVRLVGLRYTDPGLEPRMERVYPTPWTRCDREADYRQAWTEFERQLGKKMPEGTSL